MAAIRYCLVCMFVLAVFSPAGTTEYFVSLTGDDANNGRSEDAAFATVQRGVDALQPGDTLTIAPGEYFGTVRREGLGNLDVDTRIRAAIPGAVVLRGDQPAPELRKLEGYRFVYVADFDTEVHTVNELDTLSVMEAVTNITEVEFSPGTFYHDTDAGKLYLSPTDLASAGTHRYTFTVSGTHGIHLPEAKRVIIEGIAVTGFNRHSRLPRGESTDGATWGIFVQNGKQCVVRDCYAYFNSRGIATSASSEDSGDNVIERCVAWANASRYGGPYGGLSLRQPRRDVIRDSVSYLNGHKGVNIRVTDDAADRGEPALSRLIGNVSWGNNIDIRIKAASSGHLAERNVAMRPVEWFRSSHNLFDQGRGSGSDQLHSEDTIVLSAEPDLDPDREFADPANHDYRLQATSRFRGAGPDGADAGPFQYEANIYYVAPDGNDSGDGLSIEAAWRSLDRAAEALEPGDTLYIEPGTYHQSLRLTGGSDDAAEPIAIRGRGAGKVVIEGPGRIEGARHIELERLNFADTVNVVASETVRFKNSRFAGSAASLEADRVNDLRVTHCEFTGFDNAAIVLRDSTGVFLQGNLFDNAHGPAVRTETTRAIRYSDYNSYRDAAAAWAVAGSAWSTGQLDRAGFDRHASELTPRYEMDGGVPVLQNPDAFTVDGPMGAAIGVYLPQHRFTDSDELRVDGPHVHSVTHTTANLEWWASSRETFTVRWGRTPAVENSETLSPINPWHPQGHHLDHYTSYSLIGLEPDTEYHFQIEHDGAVLDTLSFTTVAASQSPRTLYVAPDGDDANSGQDRQSAWRTLTHAAGQTRPGDTVKIAGGVYNELVRVRATGEANAPITFTPIPGEKVVFDGQDRLHSGFNVFNKAHIHLDGIYFRNFDRTGTRGMFYLVRSNDIQITRCFADGRRSGISPELITAGGVENLLVRNCVINGGWGFVAIGQSAGVRIENCVVLRVDITPIGAGGVRDLTIRDSIVTDNLAKKASIALVRPGHSPRNNAFFLRQPESERSIFGDGSDGQRLAEYNREHDLARPNIAVNPHFAGAEETEMFEDGILRQIDDFSDAFATNPQLIERGIGLIPEAFNDFHFHDSSNG